MKRRIHRFNLKCIVFILLVGFIRFVNSRCNSFCIMDVRYMKNFFGRKFIINYSEMMNVYKVPMDYFTMLFCTWNVAVVGVVAIFWKSPLWVQQIYLILVSAATVSSIFPICWPFFIDFITF